MAASSRSLVTLAATLIAAALPAHALLAQQSKPQNPAARDQSVSVDAASSDVDYRSNTVVFRDVVVTQGAMRVAAAQARATGLNFDDSTWTFSGNVRIAVDGGALSSDQATVDFKANRMTQARVAGSPAQFEQKLGDSNALARGRAGAIEFQVEAGLVTLSGDAWLSDGRNEISGQRLVYSVRDRRVRAGAQTGEADRIRITIRPEESKPAASPPPAAPPAAPPGAAPGTPPRP